MRRSGSKRPTSSKVAPKGQLFVVSAPSGSGKTTVMKKLLAAEKRTVRSISMTTRSPRRGECHGRDYFFVSRGQFLRAHRQGEFLETARIFGHWYGTPKKPILRALERSKDVLLGIDVKGAAQIRRSGFPATTIFLLPPSRKVLAARLRKRGTEKPKEMALRLARAQRELAQAIYYDYAVVNDRLPEAVANLRGILGAQRNRIHGDKEKCRHLLRNYLKK